VIEEKVDNYEGMELGVVKSQSQLDVEDIQQC
jgi:hypothetical protein